VYVCMYMYIHELYSLLLYVFVKLSVVFLVTQLNFDLGLLTYLVGTRAAIAVMRAITKRFIEHNQTVYVSFVNYENALDRINWKKMMEILKNIGEDWRDRRLIKELYMN